MDSLARYSHSIVIRFDLIIYGSSSMCDVNWCIKNNTLINEDHADLVIARLGNIISEADELKVVNLSIRRDLMYFLNNPPTSLDQSYALKNMLHTIIQEYTEKFPGSLSSCKIATKRQNGSIQGRTVLHSSKDFYHMSSNGLDRLTKGRPLIRKFSCLHKNKRKQSIHLI